MNNTYYILESISLDLKRIALGLHRKSFETVHRFCNEVRKREQELDRSGLDPYLDRVLKQVDVTLAAIDSDRAAEDALMYSTLLHNYAQSRLEATAS